MEREEMEGPSKSPLKTAREWYRAVRDLQAHLDNQSSLTNNRAFALLILLGTSASLAIAVDILIFPAIVVFILFYTTLYIAVKAIKGNRALQTIVVLFISLYLLGLASMVMPGINPEVPVTSELAFLVSCILYAIILYFVEWLFFGHTWLAAMAFAFQDIGDRILIGELTDTTTIERRVKPILKRYWNVRMENTLWIAAIWNLREWKRIKHLPENRIRKLLYDWIMEGLGEMSLSQYLKSKRKAQKNKNSEKKPQ